MFTKEELMNARQCSSQHKDALLQDNVCGCFHCLKIFSPTEITVWLKTGQEDREGTTGMCPFCGVDSVIGESSGYPINEELLSAMRDVWFGEK